MDNACCDPVLSTIQSQASSETLERELARRVGTRIGTRRRSRQATNIDDSSWTIFLNHSLHGFSGTEKWSGHVDMHDAVEVIHGQVNRRTGNIDTSIIDKDINSLLGFLNRLKQRCDRFFLRYVTGDAFDSTTGYVNVTFISNRIRYPVQLVNVSPSQDYRSSLL
jgi:hypothetical protein